MSTLFDKLEPKSFSQYARNLEKTDAAIKNAFKSPNIGRLNTTFIQDGLLSISNFKSKARNKLKGTKHSSSFLSTSREKVSLLTSVKDLAEGHYKYQPDFELTKTTSPSWTFPRSLKREQKRKEGSKSYSRGTLFTPKEVQGEQDCVENQLDLSRDWADSQVKKRHNNSISKDNLQDTTCSRRFNKTSRYRTQTDFRLLTSMQLNNSEVKLESSIGRNQHTKGSVNMKRQLSRPQYLNKSASFSQQQFNNSLIHEVNDTRGTRFANCPGRKQVQPCPQPEYNILNINYDVIKPKSKRGYLKFNTYVSKIRLRNQRQQLISASMVDTRVSEVRVTNGGPDFDKMLARNNQLYPQPNLNVKKKGDTCILEILRKASERQ